MYRITSLLSTVLALALIAYANDLAAPTGLTAGVTSGVIETDWDDVDGAVKYSVSILGAYDPDGDSVADVFVEFDFGTSDRTDGDSISQSDLDIPVSALDVDVNADGVLDSPVTISVRVKGLNPRKHRQNNAFSDPVIVDL